MKNEIGRKLTSLTLMTIMFAGGMTLAVPGFLPDSAIPTQAYADQGTTQGMLYLSSTEVQGAQVIQIVVDDPSIGLGASHSPPTVDINGNTIKFVQMLDGTWEAYIADLSSATATDAVGSGTSDVQFGLDCVKTLNSSTGTSKFFQSAVNTWSQSDDCSNPSDQTVDNAFEVLQDAGTVVAVGTNALAGPATLGNVDIDAVLWPFIHAIDFGADNFATYGDDTIVFTYGLDNSGNSIETNNTIVVPGQEVQLTITDNALNLDPTMIDKWTFLATSGSEASTRATDGGDTDGTVAMTGAQMGNMGFGDQGILTVTEDSTASSDSLMSTTTTDTYIFIETDDNTGVFTTHNALGDSDAEIIKTATVDDKVSFAYGGNSVTLVAATGTASSSLDAGDSWAPAEAASYSVTDPDMNRNGALQEVLDVEANNIIPTITVGTPKFLDNGTMEAVGGGGGSISFGGSESFASATQANMADDSKRMLVTLVAGSAASSTTMTITTGWDASTWGDSGEPEEMLYYDICSIADNLKTTAIAVTIDGTATIEPGGNACSGEIQWSTAVGTGITGDSEVLLAFAMTTPASTTGTAGDYVIAADLHGYGQGVTANGIYRMEAVETGNNTGTFEGTVEYVVMNSVTHAAGFAPADFVEPDGDALIIMLDSYATGSSGPRVNFGDTDVLGLTNITVGAQLDAETHTGVVSWDETSYAVGDAATFTIVDADLNTDSTIIETYKGDASLNAGVDMFVVTCDDAVCSTAITAVAVEDGPDSDTFIGVITVPGDIGEDLELGYSDSRDATGTAVIWYATSTIDSETGTISLDRQVYPVPFDKEELKEGDATVLNDFNADGTADDDGDVTVWVYVTDTDFTDDEMKATTAPGVCKLGTTSIATFGALNPNASASPKELGPGTETAQGSNVYEWSFTIDETENSVQVLGGSTVLQCTYTDTAGDTGLETSVYDSATFDLRNGTLTADKSTYIMGQDMVLTLTDEDLNLNSDSAETYAMGLIEWDSDANSSVLLNHSGCGSGSNASCFTNNPTKFEETGDSTGVFQTLTTIPESFVIGSATTQLELGEAITLTYRDAGRAGESSVAPATGDTVSTDVELSIAISNFGASITLDKTVYDWTDEVNIEVIAPDHNKNSNARENIGTTDLPVKVSTRSGQMCTGTYLLKENGEDSGVFVGYITLSGIANQNINGGTFTTGSTTTCGSGTEDGVIRTAGQDDGVTVTYEYDDGSVALASAIVQWNYSSIEFLESSVSSDGNVIVRAIDPDEDLDATIIDQITIDVYSDSDSGGIQKTLSETNEATGIFEGTISFTSTDISTGDILRVSEGDTVTAEITDYTLPGPDYTSSDDLLFAATTTVGTAFPPLERAPASDARVVDASGNSVAEVSVDQQVQIAADVTNGQGKDQAFAYLVQVQDASGVTVSLSWLTGSLTSGQSMTAAQSWTPTSSGSYTATVFVWESVSNPTALSPTVSVDIDVV